MPESEKHSDWSVLKMLEWATDWLESKNVNSPRLSVELLLADILSCNRLDLYMMYDRPLNETELKQFKPLLVRRGKHEPIQYIIGWTSFFGLHIIVNDSVLIPRPETEELVELFLKKFKDKQHGNILEIGTGSGCIALALKSEKPDWNVFAFDICPKALDLATKNATNLGLDVNFFVDDLFKPQNLPDIKFDCIISNPPYIHTSERDAIDVEVKNFEPEIALFHSSVDSVYAAIEQIGRNHLVSQGKIMLELNENRGDETMQLFAPSYWVTSIKKDFSNKDRMLFSALK